MQKLVNAHDFYIEGPLTHPYESIQMGNGDIGASVNIYSHEIKITLAKSDIWDAKYDGQPEKYVLKHDDLIAMMKERDRDLVSGKDFPQTSAYYTNTFIGDGNHGPYPKRAGAVRVYHPGLSNTRCSTRLDIYTGMLETRYHFPSGELLIKTFIEKNVNRLWMTVEGTGDIPWVGLIVEKEPDDVDRNIPMPSIKSWESDKDTGILTQKFPGGFGVDDFEWSLAGGFPKKEEGIDADYVELHAYRCRYYCAVTEGKKAIMCVGIATSTDGEGDTAERAALMSQNRTEADYEKAWASNKEQWANFWKRSSISLPNDRELESAWYRNHFGYNCALSTAVIPLGAAGNVSIQDSVPWRGDYHLNHNFQKWFVTALPTNHPEWIELYADFIEDKTSTMEYLAELIFGLKGVYCELFYFPRVPKEHTNVGNYYGRALALTGWAAQPLWHHYEYMRDKEWLGRRAYPFIKKAAEFYSNYMGKYSDESGVIYPSVRIEEPGWIKGFKGNRNVISDLVMFKNCFEWAIKASEILGVDEEWRKKWQEDLKKVQPLRYGWENGEGYVELDIDMYSQPDGERAEGIRTSRWGGGGWAVYPGEYINGDEDSELAEVYRDIIRSTNLQDPFLTKSGKRLYSGTPIIHPISSIMPTLRLGVMEQFENVKEVILSHRMTFGQASSYRLTGNSLPKEIFSRIGFLWYDWRSVENKYLGVIAVTEMMLQSQGGIIRLFPYYPNELDAEFTGLRARGGFIVEAKRSDGKVSARISSEAGEVCKVRWEGKPPAVLCNGKEINVTKEGKIISFATEAGNVYTLDCI